MKFGKFKSPAGLIRVKVRVENEEIKMVEFSGDFFLQPEEMLQELEMELKNTHIDKESLLNNIKQFYNSKNIQTPSIKPKHWLKAMEKALEE